MTDVTYPLQSEDINGLPIINPDIAKLVNEKYGKPIVSDNHIIKRRYIRTPIEQRLDSKFTARPGSKISFRLRPHSSCFLIPNESWCQLKIRYLNYTLSDEELKDGTFELFGSAQNMIEEFTVMSGNKVVYEKIPHYNYVINLLHKSHFDKETRADVMGAEGYHHTYQWYKNFDTKQAQLGTDKYPQSLYLDDLTMRQSAQDTSNGRIRTLRHSGFTTTEGGQSFASRGFVPGDGYSIHSSEFTVSTTNTGGIMPVEAFIDSKASDSIFTQGFSTENNASDQGTNSILTTGVITGMHIRKGGKDEITLSANDRTDLDTSYGILHRAPDPQQTFGFKPTGSGFFRMEQEYPCYHDNGLLVEMKLATAGEALTYGFRNPAFGRPTGAGDPSYEIIGGFMYFTLVELTMQYQEVIDRVMLNSGLYFTFQSHYGIIDRSIKVHNQQQELVTTINEDFGFLNAIYVASYRSKAETLTGNISETVPSRYSKYYWSYNGLTYPEYGKDDRLNDDIALWFHTRQGMNIMQSFIKHGQTFDQFMTGNRIVVTNFAKEPNGIMSGIDITKKDSLRFHRTFTGILDNDYQVLILDHERLVHIKDGAQTHVQA